MANDVTMADLAREIASLREELTRLRWPGGGVVDPAPDDWGRWRWHWPTPTPIPLPQPGDPAPFDRARFRVVLGLDLREVAGRILNVAPDEVTLESLDAIYVGDVIGIEPGPVVDPAPHDVGRWVRIDPRLISLPIPQPGDPSPVDRVRAVPNLKLVEAVAKLSGKKAGNVTPEDLGKVTVRDLILNLSEGPQVDPAPLDWGRFAALGRGRASVTELNARDISALDAAELEAVEHRLKGEMTRLQGLRKLVTKRKGSLGESK